MPADGTRAVDLLGSVRPMTIALHGRRCAAEGIDIEDVVQDVYLGILLRQGRAGSRYNAGRGQTSTSYQHMVSGSAGRDAMRRYRRWRRDVLMDTPPDRPSPEGEPCTMERTMERLLAPLDTDEERDMARYLAAGCTLTEIRKAMGLTEERGTELRTRVRALLLALRDDEGA